MTGACLAAVLVAALTAPVVAAGEVALRADPPTISTALGRDFGFRTTITNSGSQPTASILAHLNVLSLRREAYVDPEDWSSERTRYLGSIPAGGSTTIDWTLKAVSPGHFAAFVSVLPQAGSTDAPLNGPTVTIAIAERRTLNAGGILPLAIGIPAVLALMTISVRVRRARR